MPDFFWFVLLVLSCSIPGSSTFFLPDCLGNPTVGMRCYELLILRIFHVNPQHLVALWLGDVFFGVGKTKHKLNLVLLILPRRTVWHGSPNTGRKGRAMLVVGLDCSRAKHKLTYVVLILLLPSVGVFQVLGTPRANDKNATFKNRGKLNSR